jgi:hypothetical protein
VKPTEVPLSVPEPTEAPSMLVSPTEAPSAVAPPAPKTTVEVCPTARYYMNLDAKAFPPFHHATFLRPESTGNVRFRQRDHAVVSLVTVDWIVATMLVEKFASFVEVICTWMEGDIGRRVWRNEVYRGVRTAMLWDSPWRSWLPEIDSWKEALSLSRNQSPYKVRQHSRLATGGTRFGIPPNRAGSPSAIVIHRVKVAKSHEPFVEAYIVQNCDEYAKPLLDPYLRRLLRVFLSFHDAIRLVVNAQVWALTHSPIDGVQQIVRVLPRGLSPAIPETPNSVPGTILMNCDGLDIELNNGKRQNLLQAALYSYPWPRSPRPRKRRSTRLFGSVYPVGVRWTPALAGRPGRRQFVR